MLGADGGATAAPDDDAPLTEDEIRAHGPLDDRVVEREDGDDQDDEEVGDGA